MQSVQNHGCPGKQLFRIHSGLKKDRLELNYRRLHRSHQFLIFFTGIIPNLGEVKIKCNVR